MKYEFYRGQALMGIIIHEIDDPPSHRGDFEPSDIFQTVALLFKQEISLLESGKMDEWQIIRDKIDKPGIMLKPIDGSRKIIVNPLIHIDGSEVWWR